MGVDYSIYTYSVCIKSLVSLGKFIIIFLFSGYGHSLMALQIPNGVGIWDLYIYIYLLARERCI